MSGVWWLTSHPVSRHGEAEAKEHSKLVIPHRLISYDPNLVMPEVAEVVLHHPSVFCPCNPVSDSMFPILIFPYINFFLESSYTARPTLHQSLWDI